MALHEQAGLIHLLCICSSDCHWNGVSLLRRDEENPYLTAKAPMAGGPPTMGQRFWKELRQNWWLWGSVVFAILLVSGLLLFRNQLYDSATHGLPFLAGISLSLT